MTAASNTFYWYDLETFGINPKTSRIAQFAGVRTDAELNVVGEPLVHYCQPSDDFLPDPDATLITGITPQIAQEQGEIERNFIARIHAEFVQPNTCVMGYNNLRFDDEFMRYAFYRNFYDPYAREYANGNSRWDLIDVVRLTRTLRPEGIRWPMDEEGQPSNRLEALTAENGIEHTSAHDALSDVLATIEVAKLIRQKQPKLWTYCYQNRDKHQLAQQLSLIDPQPMLHISGMYGHAQHNMAMVLPVAKHPSNPNGVIVYDLKDNPEQWLHASADEIAERLFTPKEMLAEMGEGFERIGLKTVHLNKCPIIVPLNTLSSARAAELRIDTAQQLIHAQSLKAASHASTLVQEAFANQSFEPVDDPDQSLYSGGFASAGDKRLMQQVVNASLDELTHMSELPFHDARYNELLLRYRARNVGDALTEQERAYWQAHCDAQIKSGENGYLHLAQFDALMAQKMPIANAQDADVLRALSDYRAKFA